MIYALLAANVVLVFVLFMQWIERAAWMRERSELIARIQMPDIVRAREVAETFPQTREPSAEEFDWTKFLPSEEDLALIGEEQA